MIQRHVDKLCDRLVKSAESGELIDLGAAVTALARDVAFDFILAKSTNSLDQKDFDVDIIQVVQGGGALWRLSKHVRFVLPLLNYIPLDWAIKISDDKMKNFFRHLKVRTQDIQPRVFCTDIRGHRGLWHIQSLLWLIQHRHRQRQGGNR